MTTTTKRAPRPGYREHDHVTDWQECDTCALRLGAGITTDHDAAYYAETHDPDDCPRVGCDGRMCLPAYEYRVKPLGGTTWSVLRDTEEIGRVDYGTLDAEGQYVGDDDALEALVREQYDIPADAEIRI